MQEGLIQPPDHQAAIAGGSNPTATANKLCNVAMNTLKNDPDLYKNLLKAFTKTGYGYPYKLLEKTVKEIAAAQGQLESGRDVQYQDNTEEIYRS